MKPLSLLSRLPVTRASLAAAGVGAAALGTAAAFTPAAWPAAAAGAAALVASLPGRYPVIGTLVAICAVVTSGIGVAAGTLPLPAGAAEGTLILAYLLALDSAESHVSGGALRWIRSRGQILAAGLTVAVITVLAASVTVRSHPWLVLVGVGAVGAVLLAAVADGPSRQ